MVTNMGESQPDRTTTLFDDTQVTWQVKASDWIQLNDNFGKASTLFTVDSKLAGRAKNCN